MIILPGKIKSVHHLKTGKIVRIFCTPNELETISLEQARMKKGYFAFSPDEIKAETEAAMKNLKIGIDENGKSKSQILRGKLFRFWNDQYEGTETFEIFYGQCMDKVIKQLTDQMK